MEALRNKARELLESGAVKVVIGYGEGAENRVRALFVRKPENVGSLVMDDRCTQNLAVYLVRREVRKLGKPVVVAQPAVVRSVLQLAAESQLAEDAVVVLGVGPAGEVVDLPDFASMERFVAAHPPALSPGDQEVRDRLEGMVPDARWEFWREQLAKCTKCYACRQACPMCYCSHCLMECNQPQWIPSSSHALGNFEWHVSRAMHLAGRCVDCGECGRVCPLDIPLHLLTHRLNESTQAHFGQQAGTSARLDFALSTFKPGDKENFIR